MENKAGEIMQNEVVIENKTVDTSQTAEAENSLGEKESSSRKKFSNNQDLLNAYNSLEAEFTRRCQKIKELERENETLKKSEQTLRNSEKQALQRGKVFKEQYPETQNILKSLYEIAANSGDDADGFLERAYVNYLKGEIEKNNNYYSSEEYILTKAVDLPSVKDKIIREYLVGVTHSKPTVGQFAGNGESLLSPPSTPKTLKEASEIARKIFERSREIK